MGQYCKRCIIETGIPGVAFDEKETCSLCNKTTLDKKYKSYKEILKNCMEFESFLKKNTNKDSYSCLLLYSGGENGAYMLNKLIKNDKVKPLVFTFNHPFKSKESISRIQELARKLNVEHIVFTPDNLSYKKIMSAVFSRKHEVLDISDDIGNKAPCIACAGLLQVILFIFAYRMGIPYILCVDPEQTSMLPVNIFEIIDKLSDILGKEILQEALGADAVDMLRRGESEGKLPTIVYPFASMAGISYDKILAELKQEGLDELSSSNSNCRLTTLLDYYSYSKYGCNYYAPEVAQKVRDGTYKRENEIEFLEEYKRIITSIAGQKEINDEDKRYISEVLERHRKSGGFIFEGSLEDIVSLNSIANALDVDLSAL